MRVRPPKLFHKLLTRMFSNTYMEELEGDLLDDFQRNLKKYSPNLAKFYFILDVLRLIRLVPRSRRNALKSKTMNNLFLFHLKFSLRSLKKHRVYQSLNIASLTLGFTCFTLIYLFVYNHYQKDSFLEQPENIARLNVIREGNETMGIHVGMPQLLKSDFPEIEGASRISSYDMDISIDANENVFTERVMNVEPDFMDIFQLDVIRGDRFPKESNGVLLSEKMALKLFPNIDSTIGKELKMNFNNKEHKKYVVGILKDLPINSSFSPQVISPLGNYENRSDLNANLSIYLSAFFKLQEGTNRSDLANRIPEYLKKHTQKESLVNVDYTFRTLKEIKQNPKFSYGFIQAVDGQAMLIFKIVGLVILLLAVANYINLTTALTLKRTHEVGVKHVMGASNRSLLNQMLTESLLIGTISIVLTGILVSILLPMIERFIGLKILIDPAQLFWIPIIAIALLLAIVLLASLYPAMLFSTTKFTDLLRSKGSNSPRNKWLRSGLMTLQFAISAFLIVGSLTFLKQLQFINKSHNLDRIGNVIIVNGKIGDQKNIIEQRLRALPEINNLSFSSIAPGPTDNRKGGMGTNEFKTSFDFYIIDENFIDIMGLNVVGGRDLYKDDRNSEYDILFNQAMIENVNEGHPLGKEYKLYGNGNSKVVGIVENFPVGSLKMEVKPSMYMQAELSDYLPSMVNKIAIRLNSNNFTSSIKKIESIWDEVYPEQPFEVEFMDDRIAKIYSDEVKMGQLFGVFTGVAVIISCLGIIGLLTYLIQIKLKEIGIRKVLGANFRTLAGLLTINIWKVLIFSSLIAFPLSYYFLEDWLTSFVYRTEISAELFVLTILFFIAIVGTTVFWQIRNAIRLNPTEVLRNE